MFGSGRSLLLGTPCKAIPDTRFSAGDPSPVAVSNSPDTLIDNPLRVAYLGRQLLTHPLYNKGTAFTRDERIELELEGLLPPEISTIEQQMERCWLSYQEKCSDLERHIYLRALQDRNETLYYALLEAHLVEMLPIIYTPTVGLACQRFSHIYRQFRGLFLSWPERDSIDRVLENGASGRDIEVIVVTDAERILGLGDQGAGGMGIPIGKLALYTACGGIDPGTTLPILLDVGTDNPERLDDPLYVGWRHARLRGEPYDAFIAQFVAAVKRRFPKAILQWEDFAQANAARLLAQYRDQLCSFNDDIQGTAAVTLGALMAAGHISGEPLRRQRVVIFGAGSAGCGIAEQLVLAMVEQGLSEVEARGRVWLIRRSGLLTDRTSDPTPSQRPFLQAHQTVIDWGLHDGDHVGLAEVVHHVRPTTLIGVSGQAGAFGETVIREMAAGVERPIVFPLSNPTSRVEVTPADLMQWTDGRAVVATGSPFPDLEQHGTLRPVAQCNNAYIFPGVGLGVLASGARRISDGLFTEAAKALAAYPHPEGEAILPPLESIRDVSTHIARAVAREAVREGLAESIDDAVLDARIDERLWEPRYHLMKKL